MLPYSEMRELSKYKSNRKVYRGIALVVLSELRIYYTASPTRQNLLYSKIAGISLALLTSAPPSIKKTSLIFGARATPWCQIDSKHF